MKGIQDDISNIIKLGLASTEFKYMYDAYNLVC